MYSCCKNKSSYRVFSPLRTMGAWPKSPPKSRVAVTAASPAQAVEPRRPPKELILHGAHSHHPATPK